MLSRYSAKAIFAAILIPISAVTAARASGPADLLRAAIDAQDRYPREIRTAHIEFADSEQRTDDYYRLTHTQLGANPKWQRMNEDFYNTLRESTLRFVGTARDPRFGALYIVDANDLPNGGSSCGFCFTFSLWRCLAP